MHNDVCTSDNTTRSTRWAAFLARCLLVLAPACGHVGIDLGGVDARVGADGGHESDAPTSTTKPPKNGESTSDKPTTRVPPSSDEDAGSNTLPLGTDGDAAYDAGDAGDGGADGGTDGGIDASVDAALDAALDANVDAGSSDVVDASEQGESDASDAGEETNDADASDSPGDAGFSAD